MKFKNIFIETKPKFKVGDKIKFKKVTGRYKDKVFKIAAIEDGKYIFDNLKDTTDINFQDDFEIVNESYISEADDNKIQKIRDAKIKIKNILPTRFGTEVIFFKSEDAKEASILVGADLDNKSIFIK